MDIKDIYHERFGSATFKRKLIIVGDFFILISYSIIFIYIIRNSSPSERFSTIFATFAVSAIIYSLFGLKKILFLKRRSTNDSEDLVREFESQFHNHLIEALKINAILDLKDIYNIYDALSPSPESHRPYMDNDKIAIYLKRFLLNLYSGKVKDVTNDQILKWKQEFSEYITKLEDIEPYSNLPNAEKGLLSDIFNHSDSASKELVKQKISDLSSIILTKENSLKQAKRDTERSTKLAIIGLALTIVFGMATVYPLLT
jgi:hypothetical protein